MPIPSQLEGEVHRRLVHGPGAINSRHCGTHVYNLAADVQRPRPLLGMPRLSTRQGFDGPEEYGWRLRTRARIKRQNRMHNRMAAASRARNRRR